MTSITIQSVRDCAAGKKYGSLMAADGNKYLFAGGMNGVFLQGQTVDVPTRTENWRDGPVTIISGRPSSAGSGVVAQQPPAQQQAPVPTQTPAAAYVPELEKQGYIMCSVMMKLLADAQLQTGKPVDTQDLPVLAKAAVATWREHIKGKV